MALSVRRLLLAVAVLGIIALLYFGTEYGLLDEGGDVEISKCSMTRMYPSYFKISTEHASRFGGSKYELFLYQDESIQRASAESVKTLNGVPLLFIPGNGGSRRQIRSIASTSARAHNTTVSQSGRIMTIEDLKREKTQFGSGRVDFFSIDLREELSAFNGGLLRDQSAFVADCVGAILRLYESSMPDPKTRPTSVILVGHSMGGVVARSVFASPNYQPGTVRTILTLNSPHVSAPLLFHRGVHSFYRRINDMWRMHCEDNYELQQTALVSIAGGLRDTQVHASLSNLDSVIPCKNHISAISTSVPDVWVSMDHTSCMWCHQLATVISAALAGLIDPATHQAHESLELRLANLRHYFHSTVPAALHLDSPHPLLAPPTVRLDPASATSSASSSSSTHQTASESTPTAVETETTTSTTTTTTSPTTTTTTTTTTTGTIQPSATTTTTTTQNGNEKQEDTHATTSTNSESSAKLSWVGALPVETKKTTVRVSGWHKLADFHVKWDLFQLAHLSHLQLLTTVPLDDLSVLLCDTAGVECLDLTKTAAPMPYSIKERGPHEWQTLKAHVIVTSLKDYYSAQGPGYQFLVVSSSHKAGSSSAHNSGIYKGEYGPEIFLVAQLTDPVEIVAMSGSWTGETEHALGQNLVSHMTLLDANKYLLHHARVVRHECNTHPIFTPLILEYSPAMREERYEQNSIALRFHEQYLSYNYRKTLQESVKESKNRVTMYSQEALHIFVFTDPVCPHSIFLRPDWMATIDVVLRNFGILTIGGFFTLAVMVMALQLRAAENNVTKPFKKPITVLAYLLTSPWLLLLITAYSLPVRFSDFFESLSSPWLQSHSFTMMARPWPYPLTCLILIVTSLVALTGWSTAVLILFTITHSVPQWIKRGFNYVAENGGSNPNSPKSNSASSASPQTTTPPTAGAPAVVSHHRRNNSLEVVTGAFPGAWCINSPKVALTSFIILALVSLFFHSAFTVAAALLILALPLNNDFPINSLQDASMLYYRQAVFVLYSPSLILLVPDMLVWLSNMHFEYRILDSYERLAIFLALHVILIKFTSPSVTLQRSAMRIQWLLFFVVLFMATYCLFPVYRAADALSIVALAFCFDHLLKVFSTPPHERFLKTH